MSRKRVIHIVSAPSSLFFLSGLKNFLSGCGWNVEFISAPGEQIFRFEEIECAKVFRVNLKREISPLSDLICILNLAFLFARARPQIVHAHTPKAGLLGMIASFVTFVPIRVYHIHGLPSETARGLRKYFLWISERVSCTLSTSVLSVSDSLRFKVGDEKIYDSDKISVLHNGSISGIDSQTRFNPDLIPNYRFLETRTHLNIPPDAFVVGFVGRLAVDKGVNDLLNAWRRVSGECDSAYLLIIGGIDARDPISQDVLSELSCLPRVLVVGERNEIQDYYKIMDVFVLPTYREGFPTVILEASSMAVPVVATRATGCIDAVVDGVTGTLVDIGCSTQLSLAILSYLNSAKLRKVHGRNGRRRCLEKFVRSDVFSEILKHYIAQQPKTSWRRIMR